MFDNLTEKFQNIFKKIKGEGTLSENNMQDAIKEVKIALLEADVNFKVVKDFIEKVRSKALGQKVLTSLVPGQVFIKIVHEELVDILGNVQSKIAISSQPPTIIMLVGLQGSGKTTASGKLSLHLKKDKHRPLLVAADIYRPSAIEQLKVLGKQIDVPVFSQDNEKDVIKISKAALEYAFSNNNDIVIIDTAGRLHIDSEMMDELKRLKQSIRPHEILLVADAMTGQEAVNISDSFNKDLGIDGIVLTKLDGDARGGAALSIKAITNKPIKFIGVGEKLDALEYFYPERMANRILGMGDILSLVEKAEGVYDAKEAEKLSKKLLTKKFDFEDFLSQLKLIKKMGSLESIISLLPGTSNLKNAQLDTKQFARTEAIILSMTKEERKNPKILNGGRRSRIAIGSGTTVQDVNRLLKQFEQMQEMIKKFGKVKNISDLKRLGIGI